MDTAYSAYLLATDQGQADAATGAKGSEFTAPGATTPAAGNGVFVLAAAWALFVIALHAVLPPT